MDSVTIKDANKPSVGYRGQRLRDETLVSIPLGNANFELVE